MKKVIKEEEKHLLDYGKIRECALKLRAVNHNLRRRIMDLLEKQPLSVTEICFRLKLEQSVASQHLAILRRAKVVIAKRSRKFVFYGVNVEECKRIDAFVTGLVG